MIQTKQESIVDQISARATDVGSKGREDISLEEKLYSARADAKICASQVAMYMDGAWRKSLFRQIDSLLDEDEWYEDDSPLKTESFATFLSLMFALRPPVRPGFGITPDGNLLASWHNNAASLTIECKANNSARYVLSRRGDEGRETAAGEIPVSRIVEVLEPYPSEQLFAHAHG